MMAMAGLIGGRIWGGGGQTWGTRLTEWGGDMMIGCLGERFGKRSWGTVSGGTCSPF